jgi:hypothetical protein
MPDFDLAPREVDALVRGMLPRDELVYRLLCRGICARCGADGRFMKRTDELTFEFRHQLADILKDAAALAERMAQTEVGRSAGRRGGVAAR